jgi:ketosteroid isomerase-like protein
MKKLSKNIQTVLAILKDEVNGDVKGALKKMTADYTMTWIYSGIHDKKLFPTTKINIKDELEEVYPIKGREYDIKNIAEGNGVVVVELVESYPDPKTNKIYRTPLVLVLEMKNGKIRTGRHYLDPRLSEKLLSKAKIEKAFKNSRGSIKIIK